jgi:hypothetical protein
MTVEILLTLAWLLLGAGLVQASGRVHGPRWRVPAWTLAALCAVVGVWVSERWLAGWHLREWPVLARDFVQVCDAVGRVRDGDWGGGPWPQRTPTSAAVAGLGARLLGVIDGLRLSGAVSLGATLVALFCWARALAGPVAGVAAAAIAISLAPVAVLPRALHVYAPSFALWVAGAAAATQAGRTRQPLALAATGLAAGGALLLDGRGLPFAGAALSAGLLAVRWRAPRQAALGLFALGAPVLASFALAHLLVPPATPTLETQTAWFLADLAGRPPHDPGVRWSHGGFLWGHSSPLALPATLSTLAELGRASRAAATTAGAPGLVPPLALLGLAVPAGLRFARRAPRAWVAGTLAALPFGLALAQALATQAHPRMLGGPVLALALAGGLGFAALATPRTPGPLPALVAGVWLLLAVGGAVPGLLHPDAGWRRPITQLPDVGPLLAIDPQPWPARTVRAGLDDPDCRHVLEADLRDGHPWGGRNLRWPRPD